MNRLVSVVVTAYNQAPYIEQALRSVFDQTYEPVEVIVVDDGSTDDTPNRIAAFSDRIVYVRQNNEGIAVSRNRGIRTASGAMLAFLDGDDVWEPEKLAIQVAAAGRYPDSGMIVVDGVEFSDSGILRASLFEQALGRFPGRPEEPIMSGRCYEELLRGNFISTTSQVMVPAQVFQSVGLSDRSFRLASDYDLYLRIAATYDVTFVKRQLAGWRYHGTSASGPEALRSLRWLEDDIAILKKHRHQASREHRLVIRRLVERRIVAAARGAYYYGRQVERRWATGYLLRLLARNRRFLSVAPFLAGVWCPEAVARALKPPVCRLLRSRLRDSGER